MNVLMYKIAKEIWLDSFFLQKGSKLLYIVFIIMLTTAGIYRTHSAFYTVVREVDSPRALF